MTGIYTDEGTLDYMAAAAELTGLKHLGNANIKAETVARVSAAALLDIAVSLGALVDALAGEREVGPDGDPMGDEERGVDEPDEVPDDRPLEVGDWVQPFPVDLDEATNLDMPSLILNIGVSEGAEWLDLKHYNDDGSVRSSGARAWAENYHSVPPMQPARPADDDAIDLRDLVDDIDSDFDEAPIDEAKPAKVKSGKGKSKSKGGE